MPNLESLDNSPAIVLGRIEGGQTYIKETLDKAIIKLDVQSDRLAAHDIVLGKHELRLNGHDDVLKERAPRRIPWVAVFAVFVSVGSLVDTLLKP